VPGQISIKGQTINIVSHQGIQTEIKGYLSDQKLATKQDKNLHSASCFSNQRIVFKSQRKSLQFPQTVTCFQRKHFGRILSKQFMSARWGTEAVAL